MHNINGSISRDKLILTIILVVIIVQLVGILIAFPLLIWGWGYNQVLLPSIVEQRLRYGMSIKEAEFNLGISPGDLTKTVTSIPDGRKVAIVSKLGIGRFFVPQHNIRLFFTKSGKLNGGNASIECSLQESALSLSFSNKEVKRSKKEK